MNTDVLRTHSPAERAAAVQRAVTLLREHEPVALPTETVYGLAADALEASAVAKIFAAKERPRFDPLIVHLPTPEWLPTIAEIGSEKLVENLASRFWPGPLTLVLRSRGRVPDIVTAGLTTVAVRMSAHELFGEIVRAFERPLAAPSANRFGRISATRAADVYEELGGRIPLIIDGGPTQHGVESTIISIKAGKIEILRRGPVSEEQLREFAAVVYPERGERPVAPGQLRSHYAPATRLQIVNDAENFSLPANLRAGLLAWKTTQASQFCEIRRLTNQGDLIEAATNLFRLLRELDRAGLDLIVAEAVPEEGIGCAMMERLRRAAAR